MMYLRVMLTFIIVMLLAASQAYSNVPISGGNVTNVALSSSLNATRWDGIYGEVVLGTAANHTISVIGNNITRLDVVAQDPGCASGYASLSIYVLAVNGTAMAAPLSAGNLTLLDNFIGDVIAQDASTTFTQNSTFVLSYGTITNVPTTYTYANNLTSADFKMGYLNDVAGQLVFVAAVVSNKPGWNGSTSDYQVMLPRSAGAPTNYTIFTDVVYTCAAPPGPGAGPGSRPGRYVEPPLVIPAQCVNDTGCNGTAYCEAGICLPKKPPGEACTREGMCQSGLCSGGKCILCNNDWQCDVWNRCVDGACVAVVCPCGIIKEHRCLPYECCQDSQCGRDSFCIDRKCVVKEISLLIVEGKPVEGEDVRIRIVNNRGEPIPFATVFTSDGQTLTADENGYVTMRVPYDGLLSARAEGYGQVGLLLNVIKKGRFFTERTIYEGKPTVIKLKDSKENPIAGARVFINGKDTGIVTDEEGKFSYMFLQSGWHSLSAKKDGYTILESNINVVATEGLACGFPLIISVMWFALPELWALWAFTFVLVAINVAIYTRRKRKGRKIVAIVYFLAPLLLALPNVCIFTICFMSNVVLLQLVIELLVVVRNKLLHKFRK